MTDLSVTYSVQGRKSGRLQRNFEASDDYFITQSQVLLSADT